MSRRAIAYSLSVAIALCLASIVQIRTRISQNRGELSDVRGLMVEESWNWSRERLAALTLRTGTGTTARAGMAVVSALTEDGPAPDPKALPGWQELAYFPLDSLLQRAFRERRFEGCLRLVDLAERSGAGLFREYEAAALLELRRIEEARAIDLGEGRNTLLGRRLEELLASGRDLERVPIRDRRGVLLGTVSSQGGDFVPEAGIDEVLVPRFAIQQLAALDLSGGVSLTIDIELSRMALQALGRYYRGSVVVVDPPTGDVLVAISDPRTWREGGTAAFEQLREPASISKLITVTAALRAGIDVDQVIGEMRCRGAVNYDEGPLYCSSINGRLHGLDRALAVSCNVAFAELGNMVGREALLDEHRRYGFAIGEGPSKYFGRVVSPYGTRRQLGELAIGLEVSEITPIHAALQAAAFTNGGWMVTPRIVRSRDTFLGYSEETMPASSRWQVVDESWLPQIVSAMKAVVAPGGTAGGIAPEGFPIALKTGTASHPLYGFHVNYIGFGPLPEPRYSFSIRVTHQRTSLRVRRAARAVTQRFLRSMAGTEPSPGVMAAGH